MPIYEYVCGKCGHRFELLQKSAAAEKEPECPACRSGEVRKEMSTFSSGSSSSTGSCPPAPGGG